MFLHSEMKCHYIYLTSVGCHSEKSWWKHQHAFAANFCINYAHGLLLAAEA